MSAVYSIFTSPTHPPVPKHLPTLIVTPHGRPEQTLYTYLHTNLNRENYLLTPSKQGDLCVGKLFPPSSRGGSSSSSGHGGAASSQTVKCEASRNLRWHITQSGIQNPIYKVTLPNTDSPEAEQPLFQVSKPNPNAGWWSFFYFTYAGHLIPPKRIEFGRMQKNEQGGGTRVTITGKSDEEKAVWQTLGESNEDMVEWIIMCASLVVSDDEIIRAAEKGGNAGPSMPRANGGAALRGQKSRGDLRDPRPPPPRSPMPESAYGQPARPPPPIRQGSMPKPVPTATGYPIPPPMSNSRGGQPSPRLPPPVPPPHQQHYQDQPPNGYGPPPSPMHAHHYQKQQHDRQMMPPPPTPSNSLPHPSQYQQHAQQQQYRPSQSPGPSQQYASSQFQQQQQQQHADPRRGAPSPPNEQYRQQQRQLPPRTHSAQQQQQQQQQQPPQPSRVHQLSDQPPSAHQYQQFLPASLTAGGGGGKAYSSGVGMSPMDRGGGGGSDYDGYRR